MKVFRFGFLLGAFVVLDRLAKIFFLRGANREFSFVHLNLFENHGLVFSLPAPNWVSLLVMCVAMIFVAGIFVRAVQQQKRNVALAMTFIFLGALSNVLDRLTYGFVIDFVSFGRWFPIFNLADVMIAVGLVWWVRNLTKQKPTT